MNEKENDELKELIKSVKEELKNKDIDELHPEVEERADKLAKKKYSD